ncbi:hypothetical protein KCP69_25905 [Salmonella enterica subsp. enterica]|nr:hypothetical protein KCP69_25905 [Salmonella enterica subsp. enterica]
MRRHRSASTSVSDVAVPRLNQPLPAACIESESFPLREYPLQKQCSATRFRKLLAHKGAKLRNADMLHCTYQKQLSTTFPTYASGMRKWRASQGNTTGFLKIMVIGYP